MNILIIENHKNANLLIPKLKKIFPNHQYLIEEIDDIYDNQLYLSLLLKWQTNKQKIDLFLIPVSLGKNYLDYYGLKISLLIRLAYEFPKYCNQPMILYGADTQEELKKLSKYKQILETPGISYVRLSLGQFHERMKNIGETDKDTIIESISNMNMEKLTTVGRHSVANDWAIYRLANFLDCVKEIDNAKYQNVIHEPYFRLLLYKLFHQRKVAPSIHPIFHEKKTNRCKFLLIDDRANYGWNKILEKILRKLNAKSQLIVKSEFKNDQALSKEEIDAMLDDTNKNDYDLIFLDLRLFSSEEDITFEELSKIQDFSGAKLLKEIKAKYPAIPIIIFTASQQAWNWEKLFDLGADGFFIKESPDNIFSDELFLDNLSNFVDAIISLTTKGNILKWFYRHSEEIKSFLDKSSFNLNIKQRIKQKLDLAFGIIRTRRRKYDFAFIYSDYHFAFLVYWSILIEFQAEKIGFYDGKGINYSLPNGKILIDNDKPNIESYQSHSVTTKWVTRFPRSSKMPKYKLATPSSVFTPGIKQYFRNLSNLIPSYILLEYGSKYHDLIDDFVYLNQLRNQLDYTHSDVSIIMNDPIHTQSNEVNDLDDCKMMFSFIYTLIMGKPIF